MTLHRFFVPAASIGAAEVLFPPEQARQIHTVLRLRPGDRLIALDGTGNELVVRLTDVGGRTVGVIEERLANTAEPRAQLALYLGLLKGAKLELVLQKCTEVGVSSFVPVVTSRSVLAEPGASRQRRFEAIVREAAEQSRRGRVPVISPALSYPQGLRHAAPRGPIVLLWEGEEAKHLAGLSLDGAQRAMSLFVGPEGGFTPVEVEEAQEMGAQIVTLGERILRAETAAIVGAALLLSSLGELG